MGSDVQSGRGDRGGVTENGEDEAGILGDQDETEGFLPEDDDEAMGGMGSDLPGADEPAFDRGDVDVAKQIDRTTRRLDEVNSRPPTGSAPSSRQ